MDWVSVCMCERSSSCLYAPGRRCEKAMQELLRWAWQLC
jgi:hypothetical protein